MAGKSRPAPVHEEGISMVADSAPKNSDQTSAAPGDDGNFEVVSPLGRVVQDDFAVSDRLTDLNGKTIAFVWDYAFRGDEMFTIIERMLKERYPDLNIVGYDTFGDIHGTDELQIVEDLTDKLLEHAADAALIGVGA